MNHHLLDEFITNKVKDLILIKNIDNIEKKNINIIETFKYKMRVLNMMNNIDNCFITVFTTIEDQDKDLIEFITCLINRKYLWYKEIFTYKPISGIYYIREIPNNHLKNIE